MKNIAFVHRCPFPFGGAEKVTTDLTLWFAERNYTIYIFAQSIDRKRLPASLLRPNIHFLTLNTRSHKSWTNFLIEQSHWLKIDVFLIQGLWLRYIHALRTRQSAKIIYCNHGVPFWQYLEKARRCEELRKRLQSYPFGNLLAKYANFSAYKAYRRVKRFYRKLYDNSHAFTLLCDAYAQEIERELNLPAINRLFTIPNAQPPAPIEYRERKQKELLYMGRLSFEDKRVDRLLQIWHSIQNDFPDWKLRIVGEGKERNRLIALSKELQLKRIEFAGSTSTPWIDYNRAAILCLTSTFEGWGLVLTEAQQAGTVPIAFGCSAGIKEILTSDSGKCGVIVDCFDLSSYASELRQLMTNDDLRQQLAIRCQEKASTYSIDAIGKKWEDLIARICDSDE